MPLLAGDTRDDAVQGGGVGDSGPHEPLPIPMLSIGALRNHTSCCLTSLPPPIYSEAFTGYGKNKIELVTHLRFAGFSILRAARAFVSPYASRQVAAEGTVGAVVA